MNSGIKNTYWFIILLTGITLVIYWPLYSGRFTLGGEAADLFLPVLSHIREAILQGDWPLWNKYQSQGLATSVFPVYWNPIFLVPGIIFPNPAISLNVVYLVLILLAGLGFYKLSGLVTEEEETAKLAGLCYPLLGFFCVNGQDIGLISTAAMTPALLFLNHRYQRSGQTHYLILLALGYYLLVTMTSPKFILIVSVLLIFQAWRSGKPKSVHSPRVWHVVGTLAAAGLLVWRILWLRESSYQSRPVSESTIESISRIFYDLASFILPKTTAVPVPMAGVEGPTHFNYYVGILVLVLAAMSLNIKRTRLDNRLGFYALACLILAGCGSYTTHEIPGYASMSGDSYAPFFQIGLTSMVLLLGLRGLTKVIKEDSNAKYGFLVLSLIGAGVGFYMENAGEDWGGGSLISWFIQLDAWKSGFFLMGTAIALWIRRIKVRYWLVGGLILVDLSLTNFLNQDLNLYHDYPNAVFADAISYPETMNSDVDIDQPVGRFDDQDLSWAGLGHNTGTLTKQIVRDGYWPWAYQSLASEPDSLYQRRWRYPVFYLSRDTSGAAIPTIFNFDDEVRIVTQKDHQWQLSIRHSYEKYLVLNQNFDYNWRASIDGLRVPVERTRVGTMQIPIKPGNFQIHFEYLPDGILHLFGFMMVLAMGLVGYLLLKRKFPLPILVTGVPIFLIYILNPADHQPTTTDEAETRPDEDIYRMTYEERAVSWFIRGDQLTLLRSHGGYRSERFNDHFIYSATLQLEQADLEGKKELDYRFHIYSPQRVELGVVLKTYTGKDESYNIEYIDSLEIGGWTTVKGRFRLDDLPEPLVKAEWYVWNHKKLEFLIDDIEIKLNP